VVKCRHHAAEVGGSLFSADPPVQRK